MFEHAIFLITCQCIKGFTWADILYLIKLAPKIIPLVSIFHWWMHSAIPDCFEFRDPPFYCAFRIWIRTTQ